MAILRINLRLIRNLFKTVTNKTNGKKNEKASDLLFFTHTDPCIRNFYN